METEEFKMKPGASAIDFELQGVDGKEYMLQSFKSKELFAVIFTCNHCPYAQAYEKRLFELAKEFSAKAAFVAINSNDAKGYPEDSFDKMKERADEKEMPYPYLSDESQKTAAAYGAKVTPHVFLFDKSRKLIYQGGIDNNWQNPAAATSHSFRDALMEASEGKKVSRRISPAIGCSIKWKS